MMKVTFKDMTFVMFISSSQTTANMYNPLPSERAMQTVDRGLRRCVYSVYG